MCAGDGNDIDTNTVVYANCLLRRPTTYLKVMSYLGILEEININKIRQARNQFRMYSDHIDGLAASIKLHDYCSPSS